METFIDYCKKFICDRIDSFVGEMHYACDFASSITEEINCNPGVEFSKDEAINCIGRWIGDAAEYWDYEKYNFGEHFHNPFDKPECYVVCMIIAACDNLLMRCPTIDKFWNGKIEFTQDIIDNIKREVVKVDEIWD